MRRTLCLALAAAAVPATPAAASEGGAAGPALVPMDEIVVPIVDGARAYGRLRLKLVIQAHDAAAAARLTATMPMWRETSVLAAAEFARLYASPLAPVDAGRLARDVSAAMHARDTDHAITRVLLVEVSAVRA